MTDEFLVTAPLADRRAAAISSLRPRPDHAISKILVKGRLWRRDVAIISVVIPYHGRCARVLDAAQSVHQLDFDHVEHDCLFEQNSLAGGLKPATLPSAREHPDCAGGVRWPRCCFRPGAARPPWCAPSNG